MKVRECFVAALSSAALVSASPVAAKPAANLAPPALSQSVAPEAVGFDQARLQRLDSYMAGVVNQGRVAGLSTLLVRHGKIVEFKTYGKASLETGAPMAKDTILRIYSMTKPLTGVAMMILYEEGKWRLDDPVTKYVPEFKNLKVMTGVDKDGKVIVEDLKRPPTMREIMSHTAGFGYGLSDTQPVDKLYRDKKVFLANGLQQMIDRTAEIPLLYQPGTNWSYSSAVDIQGYIVEKLSGMSFGQFLAERVFKPLKMNDTAFWVPPAKASRFANVYIGDDHGGLKEAKEVFGRPVPTFREPPALESGGAGLVSTSMDYARFCQMMLNGGVLDGVRILSPQSIELMDTNVVPRAVLASHSFLNDAMGFGLDFLVVNDPRKVGLLEGKNTMSWNGAAGTWFWIDPSNDLFFIGMVQRLDGDIADDVGVQARTLTYQALVHPEK